jgi:hypothetical protein
MRQPLRTMKFCAVLFASGLMAGMVVAGEVAKARFSQALSATEWTEAGINRLSSDQLAVLDALVRRDAAAQAAPRRNDPPPGARFSLRLSADERRNAGLALLTEAETARLDAFVERSASASLARTLLAPPVFYPAGSRLRPTDGKTAPEIHGSISLSYGWSKGGGTEKTGAMTLNYEDPAHGFSLNVGYSETHGKAPFPYRDVYSGPPPFVP